MNLSAIDEDAGSEVLKVLELEKSSHKLSWGYDPSYGSNPEYKNLEKERDEKGIGCFIDLYNG